MRIVPAAPNDSSLHFQLTAIMETMARSTLSQISKLVDEDSVKLRFELSKALSDNSALSDKVKRLECELASRGSFRTVGVQTEALTSDSQDWSTNQWKDGDLLHRVTELPHTSEKSTDTMTHPDTVQDSVLNTAVKEELISTEEHGENAPTESEQLQLLCFSSADSDCSLSFDAAAPEDASMQLMHCYPDEAFSSHVIPIEEEDDDDDDDVQLFVERQQECPTNFAMGSPSTSGLQTTAPDKCIVGTTEDNWNGHIPDAPDVATVRTSHMGRFPCEICRRTFFYKRTLTHHMKSHNSNFCKICKQHFPKRTKFKPHVCVPQLPNKNLVKACQVCGKFFPNPSSLRIHYLVHTGEKPHQCSFCGQTFTQKGNLKCHLRIHTGERPFHCNLCGKTFIQKVNLTCHMMSHKREIRAKAAKATS